MNRRLIGLIAARETLDLLRDRRSVFLLVVLPILLYPGFGVIGFLFAVSLGDHVSKVGIVGLEFLPKTFDRRDQHPPLIDKNRFSATYCEKSSDATHLMIQALESTATKPLDDKLIDVLVIIPPDLIENVNSNRSAKIELKNRDGDELSKLALQRVAQILRKYGEALRKARFVEKGLPTDFNEPLIIREPRDNESLTERTAADLRAELAKFFPFMLVMWALAGALHPAIDVCAGEKERGTMETLLISPASRGEIVAGKFLAVWGYSTITAWWNLAWMGGLCLLGNWRFEVTYLRPASLVACFLLAIPMTALFSSLSIALGAFARSTREGQYYLLPMFLGVVPLVMLSLLPSAELSVGMCLIPVTGLCLLLQKMIGPTPWNEVLPYAIPVLLSLIACALAATWWAVRQFHREDVLFRESEQSIFRGMWSGITGRPGG